MQAVSFGAHRRPRKWSQETVWLEVWNAWGRKLTIHHYCWDLSVAFLPSPRQALPTLAANPLTRAGSLGGHLGHTLAAFLSTADRSPILLLLLVLLGPRFR